jgi:hypothetical protein
VINARKKWGTSTLFTDMRMEAGLAKDMKGKQISATPVG